MNLKDYLKKNESMIIAEIGQNHQGDLDDALRYVDEFSRLGANVVKFQKRDNRYLFTKERYDSNYESENAFAPTYGAHRDYLELKDEEFIHLRDFAKKKEVLFMVTPFDEPSLDFLISIDVDILKVASFDLGNFSFLKKIALSGKPFIFSTGGGEYQDICASIDFVKKYTMNFAVLHCVSKYPTPYNELNLGQLVKLQKLYPDIPIGLSDHFNGTLSGPIGYMLGARIFEKHVTFDRSRRGTDHSFALEPNGFSHFCRDIGRVGSMIDGKHDGLGSEPVFQKLGKVVVAAKDLKKGHEICLDDLSGKIDMPGVGLPVRHSSSLLGMTVNRSIKVGEIITLENIDDK